MNLTRLRYFIAVAEAQNVVRAAKALNVAQPALSRQLQALEKSVGAPLFSRHSRGVTLTPAGSALLEHARAAVKAADDGINAARQASSSMVVNVSTPDWPHRAHFIVSAIEDLMERKPEIEVVFNAAPWTVSVPNLRAGIIDVGFGVSPNIEQFGPDIEPIFLLPEPGLSALISSRHPLAKKKTVRLDDLKDIPTLIPPRDKVGLLHDQMAGAIRHMGGYEPKIVDAPLAFSAATHLVGVGAGWILTVNSAGEFPAPGTVLIPIEDAVMMTGFYALRRVNDTRPAVLEFIQAVQRVVKTRQVTASGAP